LIPAELRNLDEAALDQALLKRGFQFVLDDPIRYVLLTCPASRAISNSGQSLALAHQQYVARRIVRDLFPFMLYGLALSFLNRPLKHAGLLYLFIAVYTAFTWYRGRWCAIACLWIACSSSLPRMA